MGLFSFKKKSRPGERETANERQRYVGDLEKTAILNGLCATPHDARNEAWNTRFLENAGDASFACGDPQIIQGPDGFPYFQLRLPEPNQAFECYVIRHIIPDFVLERGIGAVINADRGQPDWVFSFGDLVNFHTNGVFYSDAPQATFPAQEIIQEKESVIVGQPSETFLPVATRTILRQFLAQQGITDTKIALMSRHYGEKIVQELVTNLTPEKLGAQRFEALNAYLPWFLPRHIPVIAMDEQGSLATQFQPL